MYEVTETVMREYEHQIKTQKPAIIVVFFYSGNYAIYLGETEFYMRRYI